MTKALAVISSKEIFSWKTPEINERRTQGRMRPLPPGKRQQTGNDGIGESGAHWLCRYARDNPVIRNIAGNNGTCTNNSACADTYFRTYYCAMADPAIMADR